MSPEAAPTIEVTAYAWVPSFARGQVRDLRVRWALEEVGLPYRTRLLGGERSTEYYREQPWGQVPAYREGELQMFECGAIALHIAEKDERLLPRDPVGRARALSWLFAALNSVDPQIGGLNVVTLFHANAEWSAAAAPVFREGVMRRLTRLSDWLGDKEWLEDRFTVGDLMMVATLRSLSSETLAEASESLAAYVARGEARPAFQRALAAQLGDFVADPV